MAFLLLTTSNIVTAQCYPGQNIIFSNYEQDNNLGNGAEPILWKVLNVSNGKMLLLSEYAIDAQPYNWTYAGVTWETSSLRNWLNNDFLYSAFSSRERNSIVETSITNNSNPANGTSGGQNTQDKLFVLSISEVQRYFR